MAKAIVVKILCSKKILTFPLLCVPRRECRIVHPFELEKSVEGKFSPPLACLWICVFVIVLRMAVVVWLVVMAKRNFLLLFLMLWISSVVDGLLSSKWTLHFSSDRVDW